MTPSHIPFIVSMICLKCNDTTIVKDLIRSNLGPLLDTEDYIYCYRMNTSVIECDVYAPWKNVQTCCKQLEETFTRETLVDILNNEVTDIQVDCQLPNKYT
jgi:hypothetical protein